MVNYRRARLPGGTYFFTVTLQDRQARLLTEHIDLLRQAFRQTHHARPFDIEAIVVLPDHLHTLWTLPEHDADYATRWRAIKSRFSQALAARGLVGKRNHRGEYAFWQRRYWEHVIRDEEDWRRHVEYIHFNPVKHGLVARVAEWPYSSFHRYVRRGVVAVEWGGGAVESDGGVFGE